MTTRMVRPATRVKGLLAVGLILTGCAVANTSLAPTSPDPTSSVADLPSIGADPTPTFKTAESMPAPTSKYRLSAAPASSRASAVPVDPALAATFAAAWARLRTAQAGAANGDAAADPAGHWPATQVASRKVADAIRAFRVDLEAMSFPDSVERNGTVWELGRDSAALIGWSKQMEDTVRKVAALPSWESTQRDTIDFQGTSYPTLAFLQDADGEWRAALHLVAEDLGVEQPG